MPQHSCCRITSDISIELKSSRETTPENEIDRGQHEVGKNGENVTGYVMNNLEHN